MRKAKIYIDLSVFINLDYLTGIQRVSEEIILRLLKNKNTNIVLITYSEENECFRIINNKESFINYHKMEFSLDVILVKMNM